MADSDPQAELAETEVKISALKRALVGQHRAAAMDALFFRQLGRGRCLRKRLTDVSTIPLIYPYWHQRNFAASRFGEGDLALHRDFAQE